MAFHRHLPVGNNNSLIVLAIFVFILYLAASGKLTQIIKIINPNATSAATTTGGGGSRPKAR